MNNKQLFRALVASELTAPTYEGIEDGVWTIALQEKLSGLTLVAEDSFWYIKNTERDLSVTGPRSYGGMAAAAKVAALLLKSDDAVPSDEDELEDWDDLQGRVYELLVDCTNAGPTHAAGYAWFDDLTAEEFRTVVYDYNPTGWRLIDDNTQKPITKRMPYTSLVDMLMAIQYLNQSD